MREIAKRRITTVDTLMAAGDYEGAAYLIGLTGEIALKAVICKKLKLTEYPPSTTTRNQQNYLKTHDHQELMVLAGLQTTFDPAQGTPEAQNWSDYTTQYKGDWISKLRYNEAGMGPKLTDAEVIRLHDALIKDEHSIINYIKVKRLW